jgi:hypothetical protein
MMPPLAAIQRNSLDGFCCLEVLAAVVTTVSVEVALVVVLLSVTDAGLSEQLIPEMADDGLQARLTAPLKLLPVAAATVIVEVPEPPAATEIVDGVGGGVFTVNGGVTVNATDPV